MGVSTDFSWAGLRCHSGMSLSFLYSMPRSTSQVSWWRHENLHPLIRDRQHQTAGTSQGEGTAPRHPLQKKCPGRRTQEHTEKAMWSLGGLGEAEGLGGALSLRGQGDSGPPGAPDGGGAASQGGTSETSYLAAICILMVPPAVLPIALQEGKVTGKYRTPSQKWQRGFYVHGGFDGRVKPGKA